MKSCQIFKTKKGYKIATMYRLESWSYIESKPIYIFPLETSIEQLSRALFESLDSSREISESEENDFCLGNQLLKELKESSYSSLYKNSYGCIVSVKNNKFIIEPQKYMGKDEGLAVDENRVLKFGVNLDKKHLTEKVIDVLSPPPPPRPRLQRG